jgi:uncharacterized Zn-finger protein
MGSGAEINHPKIYIPVFSETSFDLQIFKE